MWSGKVFVVAFLGSFVGCLNAMSFEGYKVLRVHPKTVEEHKAVEEFIEKNTLDTWRTSHKLGDPVDIVLPTASIREANVHFAGLKIATQIIISNVESVLKHFAEDNSKKRLPEQRDMYDSYHTLDEIYAWLDEIVLTCGADCSLIEVGTSFEGRPLKVLKISKGTGDKQKIWVDGGIHAREWISPPTVMYMIQNVVADLQNGGDLVEWYDWFFFPVINVDGYVFTWTNNRMWRKTRHTYSNTTCIGVDANRNFDFMWMTIGASDNPCSETFAGFAPFSEPESLALANFVMENVADNGIIFFTTHSYSQLWMTPFGYTDELPPNYDAMMEAGLVGVNALTAVYGTPYELGPAYTIIYPSSGTSRDWAAGVPQFPYVYTIELRDQGQYGFLLPADQIRPTVTETWAGFSAMVNYIHSL